MGSGVFRIKKLREMSFVWSHFQEAQFLGFFVKASHTTRSPFFFRTMTDSVRAENHHAPKQHDFTE